MLLGVVEVVSFVAVQVDLSRRPAGLVRGSKARWRMLAAINLLGPLAYLLRGRRTTSP